MNIAEKLSSITEVHTVEKVSKNKYKILVDENAKLTDLYNIFKEIGNVMFVFSDVDDGNFWVELETHNHVSNLSKNQIIGLIEGLISAANWNLQKYVGNESVYAFYRGQEKTLINLKRAILKEEDYGMAREWIDSNIEEKAKYKEIGGESF